MTATPTTQELMQTALTVSRNTVPFDSNRAYSQGALVYEEDRKDLVSIAVNNVPAGKDIQLSNRDYWIRIQKPLVANYMVGAAGIVFNSRHEVLVGERLDYDGNLVLALMGGKPEGYESMAEGVAREMFEETGLNLPPERYTMLGICEAMASKTQRCLTTYLAAVITPEEEATVQNMEPHKCISLKFMTVDEIRRYGLWQDGIMYVKQAHARVVVGAL